MIRCRIARLLDGRAQYLTFIGPSVEAIPRGWCYVTRRIIRSKQP